MGKCCTCIYSICVCINTVFACPDSSSICPSSAAGCSERRQRWGRWAGERPVPSAGRAEPDGSWQREGLPAPSAPTLWWEPHLLQSGGPSRLASWTLPASQLSQRDQGWSQTPAWRGLRETRLAACEWTGEAEALAWVSSSACSGTYDVLQACLSDGEELLVGLDAEGVNQVAQVARHWSRFSWVKGLKSNKYVHIIKYISNFSVRQLLIPSRQIICY